MSDHQAIPLLLSTNVSECIDPMMQAQYPPEAAAEVESPESFNQKTSKFQDYPIYDYWSG